jgi:hypothetical protein
MLADRRIEAGIDTELGGIIYRLARRHNVSIAEMAKCIYSSKAYIALSDPETLLYKEDLLRLVDYFETSMQNEGLIDEI